MGRPKADIKGGCGGAAAPHVNGGVWGGAGGCGVGLDESGRLFSLIRCGCVSGFVMGVQYHFSKTQLALVPEVDKPIPEVSI